MTDSGPELVFPGRSLHPGAADGQILGLGQPLSFWGGVNASGRVVEARHPQYGTVLTGRLVTMPTGRGSSSSTAVLAELIRAGRAPAAILLSECDAIVVTGVLVAAEIYGMSIPLVQLASSDLARLPTGSHAVVHAGAAGGDADVVLGP